MKITRCETFICGNPWKNWLFSRVHTDEGLYGIGEGTVNGFAKTVESAIHELEPLYLGMDPRDLDGIYRRMFFEIYADGGQVHGAAVSAITTACLDIIGKAENKPVYELLGGRKHQQLRVYANGWYRGERTPESFAEQAREVVRRGYTALKFDPFGSAWKTMEPADESLSIDIVAAVREAVGPKVDVLVEGHNRFTVEQAIRIARRLEPHKPTWFETPVHHHSIREMAEVSKESPVPIACGEDYHHLEQFKELLATSRVRILQPEPLHLGGLHIAHRLDDLAQSNGAVICPHSAQGPVCSAACAHLNTASGAFFLHEMFDDFNVEDHPWEADVLTGAIQVKNGVIEASDRPGLGVDLNLDVVRAHPYEVQNFIPLFHTGWEKRKGFR